MARLIAVHKTPKDPKAYDEHYFNVHVPLAKAFPGLERYSVSRGPIQDADGKPSDIHLIATLYFKDLGTARAALDGPAGAAAIADLPNFAEPGNIDILLYDDEQL